METDPTCHFCVVRFISRDRILGVDPDTGIATAVCTRAATDRTHPTSVADEDPFDSTESTFRDGRRRRLGWGGGENWTFRTL